MPKALIFGVSGQDGAYLAKLLIEHGYEVHGTSRDAQVTAFGNLTRLGIRDQVQVWSAAINDFRSVLQTLARVAPDEVYNLAGQTSVGLSFEQPVETLESVAIGTFNILEALRFRGQPTKFYNACSSECFGETGGEPAQETTPFHPRSPYAVAKATAFWSVANYREAYGLFACSGVLFNHESPLRPERFVTQKIVNAACRIAAAGKGKLKLGNLDVERDWGWAPEFVDAMHRMLQKPEAADYVIATGECHPLRHFVERAFACVDLDWRDFVETDQALLRPTDLRRGWGNPAKAARELDWKPQVRMNEVVERMVEACQRRGGAASQ